MLYYYKKNKNYDTSHCQKEMNEIKKQKRKFILKIYIYIKNALLFQILEKKKINMEIYFGQDITDSILGYKKYICF